MPVKPATKTAMPHRAPAERTRTFEEVNLGYTPARAAFEASRCLQCQDPRCESGCPVRVPIKAFVGCVAEGRLAEAFNLIREANSLPAVCGRVCPQESQCEKECTLGGPSGLKYSPVGIGHLERFVADWARDHRFSPSPLVGEVGRGPHTNESPVDSRLHVADQARVRGLKGPKVAIVGSGPSGLTAAGRLAQRGYRVTVFEALHEPGGVLRYGIPEFRLPKSVLDDEIAELKASGVEIVCNIIIGKTLSLDQLMKEMKFKAVFIGTGAGLPRFLGVPGENLNGVYSANEFLTRINLMKAFRFPEYDTPLKIGKRVAVVGAGNTAMDAVRSALRMGAEEVHVVYRRSEKEMTAREEEFIHAKEEGVVFHWLSNPVRVVGSEAGWVTGLECQPMQLGEPDASGRARPVPDDLPTETLPVDTVVVAVGTSPNRLLTRGGALETTSWGGLVVREDTAETSRPGVYAGGDAVTGAATVILAAGAGRRAGSG